jgi:hypothetical protein
MTTVVRSTHMPTAYRTARSDVVVWFVGIT